MPYNLTDLDDNVGTFGKYDAEIIDAGVAHGDYGEILVFVCKPANEKMRTNTLFLSMGKGDFKLGGKPKVVTIGEGITKRSTETYPEIVGGPRIKTITNAGLFLSALKHLGFEVETGVITEHIGLKLTLEEMAGNEVIKRFNEAHPNVKDLPVRPGEFGDKTVTIPVALIDVKKSLKQRIMEEADGKTENEMIAWAKAGDIDYSEMFDILEGTDEIEKIEGVDGKQISYSVLKRA